MSPAQPIREYVFTAHAIAEMSRRGLDEEVIREILAQPEQRLPVRPGRDVLQSRREMGRENLPDPRLRGRGPLTGRSRHGLPNEQD